MCVRAQGRGGRAQRAGGRAVGRGLGDPGGLHRQDAVQHHVHRHAGGSGASLPLILRIDSDVVRATIILICLGLDDEQGQYLTDTISLEIQPVVLKVLIHPIINARMKFGSHA
jgi:hypothetical protein